ncbi:putative Ig domain-containing protein [Streptomyces sp. NPDC002788]
MPKGLTIDEKTGLVSGIPQVPGTYTVTVKATNTAGTATESVKLTVQNA